MTQDATNDDDADGDEADVELFPNGALAGDKVSPQTLVKRGLPVTVTVSLSKAEVPTKSGLMDPTKAGRVLVSYLPGTVHEVPQRDGDEDTLVGWKIRQDLRAVFVADANDEAELIRVEFAALVALDPTAAAAVLGELQQMSGLRAVA